MGADSRLLRPDLAVRRTVEPRLHSVLIDLAQAGRDRAQLGLDPAWQIVTHHGQPLKDEVPRKIRIHSVFEDHDHLRQAGLRQRSDLLHAGQARHLGLDGKSHQPLDLFGTEPARFRQDHHLDVRDVGKGVDGQAQPRDAAQHQNQAPQQ